MGGKAMQRAYKAIYDNGKLTWEGEAPAEEHARVLVIVLPDTPNGIEDKERAEWLAASTAWLATTYDSDEYEYTIDDVKAS